MKINNEKILNKPIRDVKWPNFIYMVEYFLENELFCNTIGDVLNLTISEIEERAKFEKNEVFGICKTLISLDSDLFYSSKLYDSLQNDKKYSKIIEKLNKPNEPTITI